LISGGTVLFEELGHGVGNFVGAAGAELSWSIGKVYAGVEVCTHKSLPKSSEYLGMDEIRVVEADFRLCGVYVYVIVFVWHLEEDEGDGKSARFDAASI